MRKIIFISILILTLQSYLTANIPITTTISGFVYDASNGEALIGANVYLKSTYLGSSTNLSGYYAIPKIPAGEYTLIVDYLGYKPYTQKIKLNITENKKLNILLEEEVLETEEIIVSADSIRTVERLFRKPISEINITPRQLNKIPQVAETDLLRSLQTLPGILSVSDYSSALYVRGGTPDQNLYLLDGTDVYNPEHAFGLFSTFNTDAIKQVDISKGGFGAEYGGRLSSVLNITNLDGNREEFEGSTSISLLSAKTTLQMPIGDFGSISGSIRRTYFDKTIAKAKDDIPDYYYYDGNFKAFFEINKNNKLTISGYGGRDVLDLVFNRQASDKAGFQFDWGNKTGSIRWTKVFTPKLFSNFWITGSRFSSNIVLDEFKITERNLISDITLKGNLEYFYSSRFSTKFGFEQKNLHGIYEQLSTEGEIRIDNKPGLLAAYIQGNWKPTPLWDIETGLRYNLFKSDTTFQNIAPRFSMKYRISDKVNLKAATGIYYQYLHKVPRFFVSDIWSMSNRFQAESKSVHYILGYQQEIKDDYEFEIEAFYKNYENIYSFNQNVGADITTTEFNDEGKPIYTETKGIYNRGDGKSIGFEIFLRKDTGRMTGWIGYSFSKTKHKIDSINQNRFFSPRHDRTSTLNIVSNINLAKTQGKWLLGFNFVYSTGQAFTEPGSGYIIGSSPGAPERYVEYAPTKINNIRFPYYARLDVSLTYTKNFKNWAIAPYVQVYNLGNRKNVWFVNYEYSNGIPNVEEQNMLPILPTLGVNVKF